MNEYAVGDPINIIQGVYHDHLGGTPAWIVEIRPGGYCATMTEDLKGLRFFVHPYEIEKRVPDGTNT